MRVERTKKGFPALWEDGGAGTNTGVARIIAAPDGSPMTPVYIRRRGSLASGNHALFIVKPGCFVIEARQHRRDFTIEIYKIKGFDGDEAILERVNSFDYGEWDTELTPELLPAIEAAKEKALCYHCREPHYIKTE